ncbi:histidine--tRNA ligase [Striga asiatica]|uniref:Histidine--tRNA ligase n=1 Tax=Striga asiatica TaxID=4170 RepID=A0A5A7P526_STRAF|nr:histidine--tRNA ligase [Striga asiatica]
MSRASGEGGPLGEGPFEAFHLGRRLNVFRDCSETGGSHLSHLLRHLRPTPPHRLRRLSHLLQHLCDVRAPVGVSMVGRVFNNLITRLDSGEDKEVKETADDGFNRRGDVVVFSGGCSLRRTPCAQSKGRRKPSGQSGGRRLCAVSTGMEVCRIWRGGQVKATGSNSGTVSSTSKVQFPVNLRSSSVEADEVEGQSSLPVRAGLITALSEQVPTGSNFKCQQICLDGGASVEHNPQLPTEVVSTHRPNSSNQTNPVIWAASHQGQIPSNISGSNHTPHLHPQPTTNRNQTIAAPSRTTISESPPANMLLLTDDLISGNLSAGIGVSYNHRKVAGFSDPHPVGIRYPVAFGTLPSDTPSPVTHLPALEDGASGKINPHLLSDKDPIPSGSFTRVTTLVGSSATPIRVGRYDLWDTLREIAESMEGLPWMVSGDFNIFLHPDERVGGRSDRSREMWDFAQAVADCELIDAGCDGERFTWVRDGLKERLDRALVSEA